MKDSNKELVDLIREGLKNSRELPYREGAWEAYKAKYEPTRAIRRLAPLWVAAAAAALVGFVFLFTDWNDSREPNNVAQIKQKNTIFVPTDKSQTEKADQFVSSDKQNTRNGGQPMSNSDGVIALENKGLRHQPRLSLQQMAKLEARDVQKLDVKILENMSVRAKELQAPDLISFRDDTESLKVLLDKDDLIPGQEIDPNFAYQSDAPRHLSPKKLRITDRFELGAYLSPSTTDRSFDLGGGLVFAYRFNDKLAIRTGASFNQYEVGMLQSHVQEIGEIKKQAAAPIKNADKVISKEAASLRTDNFFIPNLNAITGKIQTLDIPLEIRYNLTKEFYATGGVSYAAVLSQERFDHYETSAGIPTYSSASDSEKPTKNPVTTMETTQKSEDENINPNGFGGFVNFSIGRKTNIGKTMKVSIEPFVKLPVGEFRRADMNYTNGGIRIITSF